MEELASIVDGNQSITQLSIFIAYFRCKMEMKMSSC